MDLETAAAELYGLAPEEFVARRTALAKQVRTAGDRALATTIQGMARPTRSAWLVNLLSRHQPQVLAELFELAELLAEGMRTASGPELAELTRQRNTVVASLTQTAVGLGHDRGHRATEATRREVNDSLTAALAEPQVAAAVRAGTLTRAVQWSGFGIPEIDSVSAVPLPRPVAEVVELAPRREAAQDRRRAEEVARLEEELAALTAAVEEAAATVGQARAEAEAARADADAARAAAAAAQEALAAARARLAEAEDQVAATAQALDRAEAELSTAEAGVSTAEAGLHTQQRRADAVRDQWAELEKND